MLMVSIGSIMAQGASVRRARKQKVPPMAGFIVTWDVNSKDRAQCVRVRRFVYGRKERSDGDERKYRGLVHREGVEYLGQSTLFVSRDVLKDLRRFFDENAVTHVIKEAWVGATVA